MDTSDFNKDKLRLLLNEYKSEPDYADERVSIELINIVFLNNVGAPTENNDYNLVMKKVVLLNALMLTNLQMLNEWANNMTEAILNITDFDDSLQKRRLSLVDDIRREYKALSNRDCYTFATKYCHMHNHDYPIRDRKVVSEVIYHVIKNCDIRDRTWRDLNDYQNFTEAVEDVVNHYGLDFEDGRDLDKALWIYGNEKNELEEKKKKKGRKI